MNLKIKTDQAINPPLQYILHIMALTSLNIIHLNVQHWNNNKTSISNYMLEHNPDVVTINSHGIQDTAKNVKIFGYSGLTVDHGAHRGTAILVKDTIQHTLHSSEFNNSPFLYATIVTNHGKLNIGTFYTPPRINTLPILDIQHLINKQDPFIILADANAHHQDFGHTFQDFRGQVLSLHMLHNNITYLGPDFKTWYSGGHSGKPDIVIGKHLHRYALNITEGRKITSDHIPIHVHLNCNPILVPAAPRLDFAKANWEQFQNTLEELPLPQVHNSTTAQIDNFWVDTISHIQQAIRANIPTTEWRIIRHAPLSTHTKQLMIIYNTRFQLNKQHPNPQDTQQLTDLLGDIRRSARADFQADFCESVRDLIGTRSNNPAQYWKNIRNLLGTKNHNTGTYLKHNNQIITDHTEQLNIFRDTWKNIVRPNPPRHDRHGVTENIRTVNTWFLENHPDIVNLDNVDFNRLDANTHLIQPISSATTWLHIHKQKSKAYGPYHINSTILKKFPQKTITHITRLYNATLSTGYFPTALKVAKIILLPKPGKDHTKPENYRPISLLTPLAKTLEKIINQRLRTHLEDTEQLSDSQFGFRSQKSINDNILYTTQFVENSINMNSYSAALCFDMAKAFDKVWHKGLIYKVHNQFNLPDLTKRLIHSYITDRHYYINKFRLDSDPFMSTAGVPQGSSLSPTLYTLYTNDMPQPTCRNDMTLQYADDVTVHLSNPSLNTLRDHIQREAIAIEHYNSKWLTHNNTSKSSVTIFNANPRRVAGLPAVTVEGIPIPYKPDTKILGVVFDHRLSFNKHIKSKLPLMRHIAAKLHRFHHLPPHIQFQIFNTLVRPLITFSPLPILMAPYDTQTSIQAVQNRTLRRTLDIPWHTYTRNIDIYEDTQLETLLTHAHRLHIKHSQKVEVRNDPFFQKLMNRHTPDDRIEQIANNPPRWL